MHAGMHHKTANTAR